MKRLLLLLSALLLLLAGCVEYDEELWLKQDGSGRVKLRLTNRSHYDNYSKLISGKEKMPGIHLISKQTSQVKSAQSWIYELEFRFDSVEAFNNLNDSLSTADFWGKITLNKTPEGTVVFKRRISLGSQLPQAGAEIANPEDPYSYADEDDILEQIARKRDVHPFWNYKIHVPWKIIGTNAEKDMTDLENRVVSWKYDTEEMWNKYEEMTIEMKSGVSWLVYALIGLVGVLVVIFAFWLFRIRHRTHLHDLIQHNEEHEKQQSQAD